MIKDVNPVVNLAAEQARIVEEQKQLRLPFVDQHNVSRSVQFTTLQQLADYLKQRLDKIEFDMSLIKQSVVTIKQNTLKKKKDIVNEIKPLS